MATSTNDFIKEHNKSKEDIININEQLAENTKQFKSSKKQEKKTYITLMDDDARAEFMTVIKPILDEYGFKMSLAINSGLIGKTGYMTWDNIAQLKSEGYEILNHSEGQYGTVADITLEQLKSYHEIEKTAFVAHGLDTYDYFVYSGSMPWQNTDVKNKISEVYKCCFAISDAPKNLIPFDNYAIRRYSIPLAGTIAEIDDYFSTGGYCVLFGHSYAYDSTGITQLRAVLNYLQTNSTKFIFATAKEMVDNFKNIINLGNVGNDKFLLDVNGNVNFSLKGRSIDDLACVFYEGVNFFTGKDIALYKKNSITFELVAGDFANYWLPSAGVMRTYRFDDDRYAYQEYTKMYSNEIWGRTWDNVNMRWNKFSPIANVSVSTVNRPKFIRRGAMIFDYTLLKPLWAQDDSYGVPFVQVARNTAYTVGTYINNSSDINGGNRYIWECVQSGTTATTRPTYPNTVDSTITDGTAIFKYIGVQTYYRDATGAVIT